MKKLLIALGVLFAGTFMSCSDSFLTHTPSDALPADGAFKAAKDVSNGLNGAYYALGRSQFYGRNVVALGDMAADNCFMSGSSGHFNDICRYQITEQLVDLEDIWNYGYQVLDRATRVIRGGNDLLNSASNADKMLINSYISQAYALRALSTFALANIFCKPYSVANSGTAGIVLLKDKPILISDKITRSTLKQTYDQILSDLGEAKKAIALTKEPLTAYYMNESAIFALEARVKLYMEDYQGAITAAEAAISTRKGGLIYSKDAYFGQFKSTAISSEDIFVIGKSEDDNLSANSLNTLYGSYGGLLLPELTAIFSNTDIRTILFESVDLGTRGLKYVGLPASAATSNIPVLKLPEMYLILAEAYLKLPSANVGKSKENLLVVAKRNSAIGSESDLPATKDELLKFISEERQRELFQEGHRWFDLRRNGEQLQRTTGSHPIVNYNVFNFCYPIPLYEINASGIPQTEKWADFLPK